MRYPAAWIATDGSAGVTDVPMNSCSSRAYRNGFFRGLLLYDSDGNAWTAENAVPGRQIRLLDRLLNRSIPVRLILARCDGIGLAEFAEHLCDAVDADPDDLYDQFVERDELKRLLRAADTPGQLIHVLRTLGSDPDTNADPPQR